MITIQVNASTKYDVLVGKGLLARAGELTKEVLSPCRALILTDDHVARLPIAVMCVSFLI